MSCYNVQQSLSSISLPKLIQPNFSTSTDLLQSLKMPPQLVWLITGCSSGFGEQFVHSIVARGDRVIATGRNLSRLQHLWNIGASILQLDVTDSQEIIDGKIAEAISIHGRIDVLVNNAAFIQVGTWEDLSADDFRAQFETNVFGTLKVTKALLPHFRQRKTGVNVFISSLSGWIGHDFCGAYAGSKFALEGTSSVMKRLVDGLTYAWQVSSNLSGAKQLPWAFALS